jgi:Uma2 family endonuclease
MPSLNQLKQFSVAEYHQLIASGIISEDEKVELLDGFIVKMSPQHPPHAATISRSLDYLQTIVPEGVSLRAQLPVTLSTSEPEPDIAVVRSDLDDYVEHHPYPQDIYWLIEVADSSLAVNKSEKANLYARATIREYWILGVRDRTLTVYLDSSNSGYQSELRYAETEIVSPQAFPELGIEVGRMLPRDIHQSS